MTTAHDFEFTSIRGEPLPMSQFAGKVVLVVNVASKCGLTPQYDGLEKLYTEMKDKGLVVLGVPCNQFLFQEPGNEAKIEEFCRLTYGVDFPMTSKNDVKGKKAHPLFVWLKEALGKDAVPSWNFQKQLIGKDGQAIATFGPRTEPGDPNLRAAIEAALA
ncbi:MAG: glutathione peroxidase [Hyphomonadaceae bacterium]